MGKKKGGKKGGGKKGSKKADGLNQRESFLIARTNIREKELLSARSELLELQRENEILNDNVTVLTDNKDATIKGVLKKLHNADDNLQNSILDVQKVVLEKTKALNDKNRKRTEASDELNGQLCSELERNKNLEADIKRWTFYRQQGYQKDDAIISELEAQLREHNASTQAMKDFINSQINIAELKADQQLETLRKRYQKMAFEDAIRCTSPGALYEYTESESLEKWVNEQAELVQEESEKYLHLQKQNIELIAKLEQIRSWRSELPKKQPDILDDFFFEKRSIALPEIPKIRLSGRLPRMNSRRPSSLINY